MSEISQEKFRQRLLESEPLNETRNFQLQKEINAMLNHELTRRSRWSFGLGAAACALFAAFGASVVIFSSIDVWIRLIWILYTLANVICAALMFQICRRGKMDARKYPRTIAAISVVGTTLITILILIRGVMSPGSAQSTFWAVFCIAWLVLAVGGGLWVRLAQMELNTRIKLLEIESRLSELVKR